MDPFDKMLRERAQEEPFPIPADYAGRVFQTCAELNDSAVPAGPARKRRSHRWAGLAAAVLAVFIALPNGSPAAAAAMAEIPVLGAIVEIITFRNYIYDDGQSSAEVSTPVLGGGAAAEEVSGQVQAYTDALIEQFQRDQEESGGRRGLNVSSAVVLDSGNWFTLRIDAVETQASSFGFSRFYHIDKSTGEPRTLRDLFREDADYQAVLSEEVLRQMELRRDEGFFPDSFQQIDPEQNFYWGEEGALVLVFDEYSVAAGAAGMPEFSIPAEIWEPLLK